MRPAWINHRVKNLPSMTNNPTAPPPRCQRVTLEWEWHSVVESVTSFVQLHRYAGSPVLSVGQGRLQGLHTSQTRHPNTHDENSEMDDEDRHACPVPPTLLYRHAK